MAKPKTEKKKSLKDRLKVVNTLEHADILENSKFFTNEFYDTGIPALNVALSSRLDGGFSRGSTLIAGDSKTFKTMFMLTMAKQYMDINPDAIFVFYDIEFGTNEDSFKSTGIDTSRVYHKPLLNIENLTHDIVNLFEEVDETDHVFIGIDSLGAVASKKQQDDAKSGSEKADMTRAKRIKNFWMNVNPYLNIKKIPLVAIGQTYSDQGFFPKDVIGGGKGMEYFPNNIWLITKSQVKSKDKKDFLGSLFTVNVHKGRYTKEKSKFPIRVTFGGGIDKYSSLLDIGLELGFIKKGKISRSYSYYPKDQPELECVIEETSTEKFWSGLLNDKTFNETVFNHYSLGSLDKVETTGEVIEGGYTEGSSLSDSESDAVNLEDLIT